MATNVLLTGAAGFIGGSLLSDLLAKKDGILKDVKLFAPVRTHEQVRSISTLEGVTVFQLDLADKQAVIDAILDNKVDIVLHQAGAIDSRMAANLLHGLGQRRRETGNKVHLVHTSVCTMFAEAGGWPFGKVRDSDAGIVEKEKQIPKGNPTRQTNIIVADLSKAEDVTTLNVPVPVVYGRGTGLERQVSVNIPAMVRASMKLKTVYKFAQDGAPPALHVSDLSQLYVVLLERILQGEPLPTGDYGYYFAMAHRSPWWKVMDRLAESMFARGLVNSPEVKVWPSNEEAADELGFPRAFIAGIGWSSGDLVAVNGFKVGWKPQWDEERFLASIDDEVQTMLDCDKGVTSLFTTLLSGEKA
ncbi:hypothetical protein G7046_g8889 [Stylonectria norvegica]|nr:hypothetical protein G7046_g8889 [Stylonectria norvegica]